MPVGEFALPACQTALPGLGFFTGSVSLVFVFAAVVFLLKARKYLRHELRSVIDYSLLSVLAMMAWGLSAGMLVQIGLIPCAWSAPVAEVVSTLAVMFAMFYGYFLLKWAQKQSLPLFSVPEERLKKKGSRGFL